MNDDIKLLFNCWEETKDAWNFNADHMNQWDNLSFEEKVELLLLTVKGK
jgi:hypothetical protein